MSHHDDVGSAQYLGREVTDYELLLWPFNDDTRAKINAVMTKNLPDANFEKHENSVVYRTPNVCIAFTAVKIPYREEATFVHISKNSSDLYITEDRKRADVKGLLKEIMDDIMTAPSSGFVG